MAVKLFEINRIRLAQQVGVLFFYFTEDAYPQTRPRKRMAVDHLVRQTEFRADGAHLVLEQLTQRLQQLEVHALRQAADVVVRLDDVGLPGPGRGRLDHVRIDGALGKPFGILDFRRLCLEYFDEHTPDDLAFLLRIGDALERRKKTLHGVHADYFHTHVAREGVHYLIALVQAQQAVIDKDTR